MFSQVYFGARFYPPVYFGEYGADGTPIEPPPVVRGGGTSVNYQARWPTTGTARPKGVSARFAVGRAEAYGEIAPPDGTAYPLGVVAWFSVGQARASVSVVAQARGARPAPTFTAEDLALIALLLDDDADPSDEAE